MYWYLQTYLQYEDIEAQSQHFQLFEYFRLFQTSSEKYTET